MKQLAYAAICLHFCLSIYAEESKPIKGLPRALWQSAIDNNCKDLDLFYEKIDSHKPPFTFDLLDDHMNSAAYICDIETNKIVIWQRHDRWATPKPFSCSKTIMSRKISAGGLSVKHGEVDLSSLYELEDPGWKSGPSVFAETFSLELVYDGLSTVLTCYDGKWYFNNYD